MRSRSRHSPFVFVVLLITLVSGSNPLRAAGPPADDSAVQVAVLFRANPSHREAATALNQTLAESGYESILIELPSGKDTAAQRQALDALAAAKPDVIATGGTKATLLALQHVADVPVIFFIVPNALDASFMSVDGPHRDRVAGITTDIAPDEQIRWLTSLCPGIQNVGILSSARSLKTASRIRNAGDKVGIAVQLIDANRDEFPPAIEALKRHKCDAALMIPDAQVYNSLTVQRLLLWGISQKKPISAFSSHVVTAGALTGIYCDNHAIGQQTAELIDRVLRGENVEAIGLQYPRRVIRAVNERTAELIDITLDERTLGPDTARLGNR